MSNIKKANGRPQLGKTNGEDPAVTPKTGRTSAAQAASEKPGGIAGVCDAGRIAIYARVSTQQQEKEQTVHSQVSAILRFAEEQGIVVGDESVFTDEGYSGSTLIRPALDELRDRVAEGRYGAVLIYDPDRLARSFVHQALLIEEFEERGCRLMFVRRPIGQSPDEQLLLQMQGAIAEYERAKIAERTRRGKLHQMREGKLVGGRRTFGYHYVRRSAEAPAHFELIDTEAEKVRQMFDWYANENCSLRAIATRLNDAAIQTIRGNRWRHPSVRQVLTNAMYTGTGYANRVEAVLPKTDRPLDPVYRRYPKTGKRLRNRDEWLPFSCPAIISQETFDIAQTRFEENKAMSSRNTRRDYLLRGFIICADCGKHIQVYAQNQRYTCPYRRAKYAADCGLKQCTNSVRFPTGQLDEMVWQEIVKLLDKPSMLKEQHRALKGKLSPKATGGQDALTQKKKKLQEQLKRINALFIKGMIEEKAHSEKYRTVNDQILVIDKQLKAHEEECYEEKEVIRLLETFSGFKKTINQELKTADFATRRKIAEQIVKRVIVGKSDITIEYAVPLKKCSLRTVSGDQ